MRHISTDPLESGILQVLAKQDKIGMTDLQAVLAADYDLRYTRQHLYKVVGKMVNAGILTKISSKIGIDYRWAAFLHTIAGDVLSRRNAGTLDDLDLDLKEGEKREFAGDSMRGITALWDQIYLALMNASPTKEFYEYVSHPYWALCLPLHPEYFQSIYVKSSVYMTLIGNDTPLDRHALEDIRHHPGRDSAIAIDTQFEKSGYELEVIDDYVIEFFLPEKVNTLFEFLFQSMTEMNEQNQKMLLNIFNMKEPCTLTVRKDAKTAEQYRYLIRSRCGRKHAEGGGMEFRA